jgi:hypothetical protein
MKASQRSSRPGTQTSMQELALAKPLKLSKKFVAQSLGLRVAEKTSPAALRFLGKGCLVPSHEGVMRPQLRPVRWICLIQAHLHLMVKAPFWHHPRKFSTLKNASKLSITRGDFEFLISLLLLYRICC